MLRSLLLQYQPAIRRQHRAVIRLFPLVALLGLLAACGGSASNATNSAAANDIGTSSGGGAPAATPSGSGSGSGGPTLPNGTPVNTYLIRTLMVSLQVNKPLDAERQITQDILATDPQAQAAGEEVDQQSDGTYTVALTFEVSAPKYDAVKAYLGSFATTYATFNATLINEKETVQNVTSQYVDLQSRLTNLRTEQQRLLQLLSQAQNLSDTLTIQDKLTDVEGQIEQIEGQINDLSGQTAYSMVTINLSAVPAAPVTPAPAQSQPWSPGGVLSSAASAMLGALQVVSDIVIWLLVFGVFWGPVVIAWYLVRRLKQRRANITKVRASSAGTP